MMKLLDYVLLSASVGFFIIGLDQLFRSPGIKAGLGVYWIFMLSVICLLFLYLRKDRPSLVQKSQKEEQTRGKIKTKNKNKKTG